MRITRTPAAALTAALAALTATMGMAAGPAQRFTHEGQTYTYTLTTLPDGRQVIKGHSRPDHRSFRFVVRGDRVAGKVGDVPVEFRVADARGAAATGQELAAR